MDTAKDIQVKTRGGFRILRGTKILTNVSVGVDGVNIPLQRINDAVATATKDLTSYEVDVEPEDLGLTLNISGYRELSQLEKESWVRVLQVRLGETKLTGEQRSDYQDLLALLAK